MRNVTSSPRSLLARLIRRIASPPIIETDTFIRGTDVVIEPGVTIHCRKLVLGDGVRIRSGTQIEMDTLVIGDYTKINNNCLLTGTSPCVIGHNCWIGHYSIIDSIGGTCIGNGVGIGAHSQLWTHIYFGDRLFGCRFATDKPLVIHDDAWLVGHCIVNPVTIHPKAMAMTGSVVTRDIPENHVWAGVPARDVTNTFGPQFGQTSLTDLRKEFANLIIEFQKTSGADPRCIAIVDKLEMDDQSRSQFCLQTREYSKLLSSTEVKFMKFLLPTKAKFNPIAERDWVSAYAKPLCDDINTRRGREGNG